MINLGWGSFEYLTMEQEWKYTVTGFIAALGGSIGMWLGLSILSLIQVQIFIIIFISNLGYNLFLLLCWKESYQREDHEESRRSQKRKQSKY